MNLVHEGVLPPDEPDFRDERREEEARRKRETPADIASEMLECAEAADPAIWGDARIAGLVRKAKDQQIEYAKRLEAAWKRERDAILADAARLGRGRVEVVYSAEKPVGNAAAMREALIAVSKAFDDSLICTDSQMSMEECDRLDDVCHKVKAALAAPPRNCDVGTTKEQTERMWSEYCLKHECVVFVHGEEQLRCPLYQDGDDCRLKWAQMPYNEKGVNDGK